MFETFHFLRPLWLAALPLLVLLAWYWVRKTQSGSGWESSIDDSLLNVLLDGAHKQANRSIGLILIAALAAASIGVAGPTWQKLPQSVEQKNDALIILLDLSLSMLAEDVKPSRIERARQEIADALRLRDEGQTALIAYAGDAHAVVPLTDDVATITNLLVALSPEMMPVFGSNPDHALTLAHELFENSFVQQGRILMVTDGVDDISSVSRHRSRAFPISVLGIGTYDGGPIPLDRVRQPGRFLQTQEGNQVIALLDDVRLREVAQLSYGKYAQADVGDQDILSILDTPLPSDDETIEVEREFDTWFDQGHWVTLLLIPLLLLSFRKGVLVCLLAVCMLPAAPAHAAGVSDVWNSLWQRSDQRGYQALRGGEPERAATLFDSEQWRSVAQYRSGDYAGALEGFQADPGITGRYNQANTVARLGDYESAIALYDQVLSVQPDHEDALYNKELVERLLQEKQDAQQEQEQNQQSQANNDSSDSQQGDQQEDQDQSEQQDESEQSDQQQQDESQSEENNEQQGSEQQMAEAEESESARDEKQEALEQWLRRVPDDPGGLLRRKFSHETKERLRSGDYSNRQGEKLW
ncbi:MAG: VWA domain-containing protein [Pseudomonadaceae bacterium]|nr:VWA domain-containing protein [Pseudomonadaceae bacterium]